MASPGDKKGQRRGVCGHIMASFDLHKRCARCRDKGIGDDDCVAKKSCVICDGFTDTQKDMLATPTYKIRKDKKAGVLVSPDQVTVIASVEDTEPVFQPSPSASQPPAHAQPESSSSAFVSVERDIKEQKKSRKSRKDHKDDKHSKKRQVSPSPDVGPPQVKSAPVPAKPPAQDQVSSGPEVVQKSKSKPAPLSSVGSDPEQSGLFLPGATGQGFAQPGSSGQVPPVDHTVSSLFGDSSVSDAYRAPPEPDNLDIDPPPSEASLSDDQISDEGEISSDTLDRPEQTEDMNYRETVRSIRSFMGWNHIPTFESDLSEPDKSNNPWKGKLPKRPARISVAMPPDDWLCQKLEKLNTVVAEGYPSRSQDSAGLKKDQFVKVPKSQNRWYQMHMIRPEGPHRPGKTLFSWHNSEAKVNSQFPRIVKASAYPATGPPSRPISQEYLRRWEKCARENSYIVNHAAGFNRCTSELQERMTGHINMLHTRINKGKAPKEVSAALSDLKDLSAFHQNVSVAMGTALQHLADSLFVHMSNLILLRRDSYLDHVKNGIKPDTYNQLRNAPLFGHGLFPDAVIRTAEQDITSHHSSGSVPRPGPGAAQQTGWRSSHRYRPYDSRDSRNTGTGDQDRQAWRQFSRNRGAVVAEDVVPTPVSLNREVTSNINDNYLLCPTPSTSVMAKLDNRILEKTVSSVVIDSPCSKTFHQTPSLPSQNVSYLAVDHAHSVCFQGQPQKKGLSPCIPKRKIKDVKGVFCASQCLFAPHVPNVPNVVPSLAVGGRLQKFWQVWLSLGANPRVVSILQEGYTLPFKIRPPLTRSPVIKSGYAHPGKSKALYQAVTDLINKLVVEKVIIRSSLAFYNRLFLVPKPNQRWRPILDLSHLNLFLKPGTFKMETPETIRLSLQKGEWVTSLDFSDAYFHIPIKDHESTSGFF